MQHITPGEDKECGKCQKCGLLQCNKQSPSDMRYLSVLPHDYYTMYLASVDVQATFVGLQTCSSSASFQLNEELMIYNALA